MKASKFTEAQRAFILKQGEQGTPVVEICRKAGISQATYFNWKKKYGGVLPQRSGILINTGTERRDDRKGYPGHRLTSVHGGPVRRDRMRTLCRKSHGGLETRRRARAR